MESHIKERVDKWLNSNIDEKTKQEIYSLQKDENELKESFYKDLEFGTGGLRGIMGVGSNRMNKYTVGMASQGLANYLKKQFPGEEISVAIAHDSRNNSNFFADVTASVFSANGIKVFLFRELRPTPQLSYAIRHLKCKSGVVITASHNPKEYNGYKAYWNDGAQLIAPHDENVINEVSNIQSIDEVNFQRNEDKIEYLGKEIDDLYLQDIVNLSLSKEAIKAQKDLKIVFSSIHGTGITLVPELLKKMGFEKIYIVEEQAIPDGNFPTVIYPNPEEVEAMTLALNKAKEIDADIVMATDPDSDRVGIGVKNDRGEFQLLNGNQTGSLLIYYLLKKWSENGKLNGRQYIVKTIVTTDLIERIAEHYKVECYNTLTGFKFIAALIGELQDQKEFIGGGEESYGYLISDFVRDKDAISSCGFLAEMAAYAKNEGKSIYEMLMEMYTRFGLYKEKLVSLTKKGISGVEEIEKMMRRLRENPPATLNGASVKILNDYDRGISKDLSSGKESKLDFPSSNVLQFITEDGTKISARPSGTEPKIKFYFSVNCTLDQEENFIKRDQELGEKIDLILKELNL
ncbi:phospho-sugar mutase [soil metagenome]